MACSADASGSACSEACSYIELPCCRGSSISMTPDAMRFAWAHRPRDENAAPKSLLADVLAFLSRLYLKIRVVILVATSDDVCIAGAGARS